MEGGGKGAVVLSERVDVFVLKIMEVWDFGSSMAGVEGVEVDVSVEVDIVIVVRRL